VGIATLTLGSIGLTVRYVAVHSNGSKQWVQLPSVPVLDEKGNTVRDRDTGKVRYVYGVDFASKDLRKAFSDEAVEAIKRFTPRAFEVSSC
jgi:hypothetical protein